jgi:hypothetical protein
MKAKKAIVLALLAILQLSTIACGSLEYEAKVAAEGPLPELQVHFIDVG